MTRPTSLPLRTTNPFPLEPVSRSGPIRATDGQRRLWWLQQVSPDQAAYNVPVGYSFQGGIDRAALDRALAGLVARHEVLRTHLIEGADGEVRQVIQAMATVPVDWVPAGDPIERQRRLDAAALRPFDLAVAPLVRAVAAELDNGGAGLLFVFHHAIIDGWSVNVLTRDLTELYMAARAGRPANLPPLTLQYADYAAWQRRHVEGGGIDAGLEFWQVQLAGHERLALPLDRPRGGDTGTAAGGVVVELTPADTAALLALAQRARCSPFMAVTAVAQAALSTFAGQTDVTIGAVMANRSRQELRDLLGFFVNTVVLRTDLSGHDLTLRQLLGRTRATVMAAYAAQDVPFELVVGALHLDHDRSQNPIFNVAITHLDPPEPPGPGDLSPWVPEVAGTARLDIELHSQFVGDRLVVTFVYKSDLFDRATIAQLAERYARLVRLGTAEPDRPLADLPVQTATEIDDLVRRYNDARPAPDVTVVDLVTQHAATTPDAVAVVGDDTTLTYAELDTAANHLARQLRALGAGPEAVVAVCHERGARLVTVLLAIAMSGAAYLPLDARLPAERLRFMIDDAGSGIVVTSMTMRHYVPDGAETLLVLDGPVDLHDAVDSGCGESAADPGPALAVAPDNLAYLIYTSGSTGRAKSVAVPHRALTRLVLGAAEYLQLGLGARMLQMGTLAFDVSALEIWGPLAHGGCVVAVDTGTLLDRLGAVLREHRVTVALLISAQLDMVATREFYDLAPLRQLVVGGDVVTPATFAATRAALPGCRVMAGYGPTECAVLASVYRDDASPPRIPLGRAVPYTRIYVLDDELRPAPVGVRGEIYLAGDGLARGYHGRPALTAESFLPDPFGPPGARMYRTRDIGRRLADGNVDFVGRADRQVKLRGFRVELGEVEHALRTLPGVNAAVAVNELVRGGPVLIAYVAAIGGTLDIEAARRTLSRILPPYMVPAHFVVLPTLPLTSNNKLDRAALPPIAFDDSGSEPPRSALEAHIVDTWSDLLGVQLGRDSDFFSHGGHSLLVPSATARVRALVGMEIPLLAMLSNSTPAAYAEVISALSARRTGPEGPIGSLSRGTWRRGGADAPRRIDTYMPEGYRPDAPESRLLVVLDGGAFVDVVRVPAILAELARVGRIPPTGAVFVDHPDWTTRNRELVDPGFVDILADEVLAAAWPGRPRRATVVGASAGALTAVRSILGRPDRFEAAVGLSGPYPDGLIAAPTTGTGRIFLYVSREEADTVLADGLTMVDAMAVTGRRLGELGYAVREVLGEGGHTFAAWQAQLPIALEWTLSTTPVPMVPVTEVDR